jgi:hypothetical protein
VTATYGSTPPRKKNMHVRLSPTGKFDLEIVAVIDVNMARVFLAFFAIHISGNVHGGLGMRVT